MDINNFEIEDFTEEFDFVIHDSHERAELLAKKGYKVKKPVWLGLVAS